MLTALAIWAALSLPAGIVVGKFIAAGHHSAVPHVCATSPCDPIAQGVFSSTVHGNSFTSQVQQDHA